MQITINTSQGEMPISKKQEIIDKAYDEISRQMNTKVRYAHKTSLSIEL